MRSSRILVTGGAGFIGSNVVDACLAEGHDVAVVDDLSTGSSANVPGAARLYRVDIRSAELHDVFRRERPEIVSHHAAQISKGSGQSRCGLKSTTTMHAPASHGEFLRINNSAATVPASSSASN